jgi:hypothetical protein
MYRFINLDYNNIESGKFSCPKCSFDAIYDAERVSWYESQRFRKLFIKWIYNYNNHDFLEHWENGGGNTLLRCW